MSPREFDADVVQARLSLASGLLEDLRGLGAVTAGRLEHDRMLRHAIERILVQLVELSVSINSHVAVTLLGEAPDDYRSSFELVERAGAIHTDLADRLRRSVGLRNVLTHDYMRVDLAIVATAVGMAISDYGAYVRQVAGWLRRRRTP